MKKLFVLVLMFMFMCTTMAFAGTVKLEWDRGIEPDLAKYTVFWRTQGEEFIRNTEAPFYHVDVIITVVNSTDMFEHPNRVSVELEGTDYEFVATATDDTGNESDYSNQVDTIYPQAPQNLSIWEIIIAFVKNIFHWFT